MAASTPEPLVSVVIPVWNRKAAVQEVLRSTLEQTVNFSLEILVVDDGSKDGTQEVVRGYGPPVRLIQRETNGGPSRARNTGIREARGRYIAFMDSDDLMLPGRLQKQVDVMESRSDVVLVFSPMTKANGLVDIPGMAIPASTRVIEHSYVELVTRGAFVPTSTVMVRTEVLRTIGMFDENIRGSEDYNLWIRMAKQGPFACLPFSTVQMRMLGDSDSATNYAIFRDVPRFFLKELDRTRLTEAEYAQAMKLLSHYAELLFKYDWTDRGRDYLVQDLREFAGVLPTGQRIKWLLLSWVPLAAAKCIKLLIKHLKKIRMLLIPTRSTY